MPRASRDEVAGERGGAILIRVTAPPVDGRANAALCVLVARLTGVPRGCVRVVAGGKGRDKLVEVDGLEASEVRLALLGPA